MGGSYPPHGRLWRRLRPLNHSFLPKKLSLSILNFFPASIVILVEFVCDHVSIPKESISVDSIKNSTFYNVISDSAYLLALNVFISEIGKETFNNEELKQGYVEPIKEETQPINLRTNDEPKMIQVSNTLTTSKKDALVALLIEFKEVFAWSYEDMPGIDTNIM